MLQIGSSWHRSSSEGELEASEEGAFVFAILATAGAAVEERLRIIGHQLHVAREVPVQADRPTAGRSRRLRGVGEQRKCVVVDVQAAITPDQFKCAPTGRA